MKPSVAKVTKVPMKLGANQGTVGLALFVVAVGVASSYVFNRFDNEVTHNINSIRAGQSPIGI